MATALGRLNPTATIDDPVVFALELLAVAATLLAIIRLASASAADASFAAVAGAGLWALVVLAVFGQAFSGRRRAARLDALRPARQQTVAKRLSASGVGDRRRYELVASDLLVPGDLVLVEANETIPTDGVVVAGVASVDKSPITGESAPVIRDDSEERSAVVGGTDVISDWLVIKVTAAPGAGFFETIVALVEQAQHPRPTMGRMITIGAICATIVATLALVHAAPEAGTALGMAELLVALMGALLPATAVVLVPLIRTSGVYELLRANIVAKSASAVEAAGRIDTVLLDKTGTITLGNRQAHALLPLPDVTAQALAEAASLASLSDETREGRSIVDFVKERYGIVPDEQRIAKSFGFSAQTRLSGVRLTDDTHIWKGATDAILVKVGSGHQTEVVQRMISRIAQAGGTPLVVARDDELLGVIHLKDTVKPGLRERFGQLRRMRIRTVMVTGDNPLTAATIAAEAGADDYVAQASPASKLDLIRTEQASGKVVAMCGDGINDAPALTQADVGITMGLVTPGVREAGGLIDLDSDPLKIMEVVRIGRRVLRRRRALTIFGIACDAAKSIVVAAGVLAPASLGFTVLDVIGRQDPRTIVLSTILFNALVVAALLPMALGVGAHYARRPTGPVARDALIAGVCGILAPIAVIPLIASALAAVGLR